MIPPSKTGNFDRLCEEVAACRKCPRMDHSARVLNRGAGNLEAKLVFVGEAPGRMGADLSGLPFHGDKAGHNFEALLSGADLTRDQLFVTNAVLCNPKDDAGNNATPNRKEIQNCSAFLRRQIDLIDAPFIVTLGSVALQAAEVIEQHGAHLREAVGTPLTWHGRTLIPLYHPGQRAMMHRGFQQQAADYKRLSTLTSTPGRSKVREGRTPVAMIAAALLKQRSTISYFALHKLLFLTEVLYQKRFGRRLTDGYFIRQQDGPYCVDLHPDRLKKAIRTLSVSRREGKYILSITGEDLFSQDSTFEVGAMLPADARDALAETMSRYGTVSESRLKAAAYLTSDMRHLLREEKRLGKRLLNAPLFSTHRTR